MTTQSGSTSLLVTPDSATSSTISAIDSNPAPVYVLTPNTLTYVGLQPSSTTYVGFLPQGSATCESVGTLTGLNLQAHSVDVQASLILTFNANAATTIYALTSTFSAAGTYGYYATKTGQLTADFVSRSVCLSVTGSSGPWVLQTVTLPVLPRVATASSITQVVTSGNVPNTDGVYYDTSASFTFVGADPSAYTRVAFVSSGSLDCSETFYGAVLLALSPISIVNPSWLPGNYYGSSFS